MSLTVKNEMCSHFVTGMRWLLAREMCQQVHRRSCILHYVAGHFFKTACGKAAVRYFSKVEHAVNEIQCWKVLGYRESPIVFGDSSPSCSLAMARHSPHSRNQLSPLSHFSTFHFGVTDRIWKFKIPKASRVIWRSPQLPYFNITWCTKHHHFICHWDK